MDTLFSARTTDGDSEIKTQTTSPQVRTVFCDGTFDGATVKLLHRYPNGDWIENTDLTFTADGSMNIQVSASTQLKGNVSSAGGSTSVNLIIL